MERKLDSVIKVLKELESLIRDNYKAEIIGVFGSFVREEQKPTSDIDLLVKFLEGASLFNLVGLADFLEDKLNISKGETTEDGLFTLISVECLGSCATAPMMQINQDYYENLTREKVDKILDELRSKA